MTNNLHYRQKTFKIVTMKTYNVMSTYVIAHCNLLCALKVWNYLNSI